MDFFFKKIKLTTRTTFEQEHLKFKIKDLLNRNNYILIDIAQPTKLTSIITYYYRIPKTFELDLQLLTKVSGANIREVANV